MRRIASLISLGFLLAACQLDLPSGSSGTGAGATSTGATSTTGSGGTGGSAPAHPCDQKTNCDTCKSCSLNVQCASLATSCSQNSACVGIDQCFAICGADADCKSQCYLQGPDGEANYRALLACIYCEACPSDCAGYVVCK
jgi:hypothetical protein